MIELQKKYQEKVIKALREQFKYQNVMAVPRLKKIIVNMGVADPQDARERRKVVEGVMEQFAVMTGQKPQMTVARKSIAGFKLRAGDPLGAMVTLRSNQMWEFLQKLIGVALPRVKDFRGVPRNAFDGQGNYSLGVEEQIIFPEIDYDKIDKIRSFQVTFVTTAKTNEEAFALLKELGMPFATEETRSN